MDTHPPTNASVATELPYPWGFKYQMAYGGQLRAGGLSRLAGDSPDGLVLSNGSPASRPVRVYHRPTGTLLDQVQSAGDGTWEVLNLSSAVDLDVQFLGTASGERDVLVPKVRAS